MKKILLFANRPYIMFDKLLFAHNICRKQPSGNYKKGEITMKKIYEQPEMELLNFDVVDIITESTGGADNENDLPGVGV